MSDYEYKIVDKRYSSDLEDAINQLAEYGWEPFLYSASANVNTSMSGTGLHACMLRRVRS